MRYMMVIAAILFSWSMAEAKGRPVYSFSLLNKSDSNACGYYRFGANTGTVGTLAPGKAIHEGYIPSRARKKAEIVFTCLSGEKEEICATAEIDLQKCLPRGKQVKNVEAFFELQKDKKVSLSLKTRDKKNRTSVIDVGTLPEATEQSHEWLERFSF